MPGVGRDSRSGARNTGKRSVGKEGRVGEERGERAKGERRSGEETEMKIGGRSEGRDGTKREGVRMP